MRRLEAVTGAGALSYLRRLEGDLGKAAGLLKRSPQEVPAAVDRLLADLKAKDKELADLKRKLASGGTRDILSDTSGVALHRFQLFAWNLRDRIGSGVVVLAGVGDGKVSLLAMVTKDLVGRYHAGKIVGALAELVGGRGGGRPDMAQAGGNDPSKVDQALAKVYDLVNAA